MPDVPEEPTPPIRPHEPITEDQILRVDAALDRTRGHRGHAAQILQVDVRRLNNIVALTPHLRAKWSKAEVVVPNTDASSELHREIGIPPFTPEEADLAGAKTKEDALWAKGWEKLQFSSEKRNFLQTVQTSYGVHWKQMGQMFQGGSAYTATELLFQFNKIMGQIQETYDSPEKFNRQMHNQWGPYVTKTAHEVRMELTDRALSIAEMFRKLNGDSERAALIAAQIEKLKVEGAKDVKKRKKAKWDKPKAPTLDAAQV